MKRYRAALFVAVAALLLIPLMAAPAFAQAPTAVDDLNQTLIEDASHTINPLTNDVDGGDGIDPTSVVVTDDVSNGTTSVNPTTGAITYTPTGDFYGLDTCSYTVDDNLGNPSNVAIVEWNVAAVPDPPAAGDDAGVVDEDDSIVLDVTSNDTDVDGDLDVTSVVVITDPANGTTVVNGATGAITYAPDSDYNGNDQFEYEISDLGGRSDTATVLITVNPLPDPPVAVNDTVSVDENAVLWIDVLANDTDLEDDIDTTTVTAVLAPSHGTVFVDTLTSWLRYTPDADFNGIDSFTYTVDDTIPLTSNEGLVYVNIISDGVLVIDNIALSWEDICASGAGCIDDAISLGDSITICVNIAPHDVDEMQTGWPKVYIPLFGGEVTGDSLIQVDSDSTKWCLADAADSSWFDIPFDLTTGGEWDAGYYYIITEVEGPGGITRDSLLVEELIDTEIPDLTGRTATWEMITDVNGDGIVSNGDVLRFAINLNPPPTAILNEICSVSGVLEGFYAGPVNITLTDPSFGGFWRFDHTVGDGILDTAAGEMTFWFHVIDDACNEDSISATLNSPVDNEPPDASGWTFDFAGVDDADSNGCLGLGDMVRFRVSGTETVPDLESLYLDLFTAGLGGPIDSSHTAVAMIDSGGGVWYLDWELQVNPQDRAADELANVIEVDYYGYDEADNSVTGETPAIDWPVDTEAPLPVTFGVCSGSQVGGEWIATVNWSNVDADADMLYLYWDAGTGTIDYNNPIAILPPGVTSWNSGGSFPLSACTEYMFDIWTIDDCGNWELEHAEPAVCERQAVLPVADLDATSIDGGHIVLEWGDQSSNAGSFEIYYGMGEEDGVINIDYDTPVATVSDTSLHTWSTEGVLTLVEHGVYWFNVYTVDTCGNVEASHPAAVWAYSDMAPAEVCVFQPEPGGVYNSANPLSVYVCPKTDADRDVVSVTAWGRVDGDTVWTSLGSASQSDEEVCFTIDLDDEELDDLVGEDVVETIELAITTVDIAGKVLTEDAAYAACDPVFTFDWSTADMTVTIDDIDGDPAVYQPFCDLIGWSVSGATNSVTSSIVGGTAPYEVVAELGYDDGGWSGDVIYDASGVSGTSVTFDLDVTGVEYGDWQLRIWWTDDAGHWTYTTGNLCIADTEAPCVAITDPIDGKYIRRAMGPDDYVNILVALNPLDNCLDPTGVLKVDLQWSSASCTGPWNSIGIDDGAPYSFDWHNMDDLAGVAQGATIYLQALVFDEQGNSSTSACVQVLVDTDTPPMEISSPDGVDCGGMLKVTGTFEVQAMLLAPYVDDIDYVGLYWKRSDYADIPDNWSNSGVTMLSEPTNETIWRWNVNTSSLDTDVNYDFRVIVWTSSGLVSYDYNGDGEFDAYTFSASNPDAATWFVDNTPLDIEISDARTTIAGNDVTISNVSCDLSDPIGRIWTQYGETVEVDAAVIPIAEEAEVVSVVWELVDAYTGDPDDCDCPVSGSTQYLGTATEAPFTVTFNPADVEFVDAYDGAWTGTLRATATNCLGHTDEECVHMVVLDTEPTEAVITQPLDGEIVYGDVTLNAAALDAENISSVEYMWRQGEGSWTSLGMSNSGAPWSVVWHTGADGVYELAAFATDQGGNVQTTVYSIMVTVSNAAPTSYIWSPAAEGWVGACAPYPVTVVAHSAAADPIDHVWVQYKPVTASGWFSVGSDDSSLDSTYAVDWNVSSLDDGWYHLRAVVMTVGGMQGTSDPIMVRVDGTDPEAEIMSINGDDTPSNTQIEAGTAIDIVVDAWDMLSEDGSASGLESVTIWIEHESTVIWSETIAASGTRYTATWPTTGLELGSYYVYAEAGDVACNTDATNYRVYLVDEILPVAWIAGFGTANTTCQDCEELYMIYAMTCCDADHLFFQIFDGAEWVNVGVGYDEGNGLWSAEWRPCDFTGDYQMRALPISSGNYDADAQPVFNATFADCGVSPTDASGATVAFIDKTFENLGIVDVTTTATGAAHGMMAVYAEADDNDLGYEVISLKKNPSDAGHMQGGFDNGPISHGGVGTFWASYNDDGVTYLAYANLTVWNVDPDVGFPGCASDAALGAEVCIQPGALTSDNGAFMMPALMPTLEPDQAHLRVWGYAPGMVTAIRLTHEGEGTSFVNGKYAKIKITYDAGAPSPSDLAIAYWDDDDWMFDNDQVFVNSGVEGFNATDHTVEFWARDLHGMYAVVSDGGQCDCFSVTVEQDTMVPWSNGYTSMCPTIYTTIRSNIQGMDENEDIDASSFIMTLDGVPILSQNDAAHGWDWNYDDVAGRLAVWCDSYEYYESSEDVVRLTEGSHTVWVQAKNYQGACCEATYDFMVDGTPPAVFMDDDEIYIEKNPMFTFTVSDLGAGVDYNSIYVSLYDYTESYTNGTQNSVPQSRWFYTETPTGITHGEGGELSFALTPHMANYRRVLAVIHDGTMNDEYYDGLYYHEFGNDDGVHDLVGNAAAPLFRMFTVKAGSDIEIGDEAWNEPNPFDPWAGDVTEIHLNASGGVVSVKIYDLAGENVITLAEQMPVGSSDGSLYWDGKVDGKHVASGVYLCHISGENQGRSFSRVLKIAVVKRD